MREIYISTDIEADGPIPGPYSMLSFGSAAFLADKTLLGTFSVNLETLPDATGHPETMAWWRTQPEAWTACRQNIQPPERAMINYVRWINGLAGEPVFVGYPAAFDFMFISWYLIRFTGQSPFAFSALDIKSFAMAELKTDFLQTTKSEMPKHWFDELPYTHVALDDALSQGALFCNMLAQSRKGPPRS